MTAYSGQSIWIIGASSGIGKALAISLHGMGARLILSARDASSLNDLNAILKNEATVLPVDVTDLSSVETATNKIFQDHIRLDRIIYMAGQYQPMPFAQMDMKTAQSIVATNLTGALNVIHAALPPLLKQKNGQIALCGSIAGYRGLPRSQPYGATKAALINIAESLRAETLTAGIDIKIINPGFVRTRLTDKNDFTMPMIIEPEQAAEAIAHGLLQRSFEVHFPKRLTILAKILRLLPPFLYFRITSAMVKK